MRQKQQHRAQQVVPSQDRMTRLAVRIVEVKFTSLACGLLRQDNGPKSNRPHADKMCLLEDVAAMVQARLDTTRWQQCAAAA